MYICITGDEPYLHPFPGARSQDASPSDEVLGQASKMHKDYMVYGTYSYSYWGFC